MVISAFSLYEIKLNCQKISHNSLLKYISFLNPVQCLIDTCMYQIYYTTVLHSWPRNLVNEWQRFDWIMQMVHPLNIRCIWYMLCALSEEYFIQSIFNLASFTRILHTIYIFHSASYHFSIWYNICMCISYSPSIFVTSLLIHILYNISPYHSYQIWHLYIDTGRHFAIFYLAYTGIISLSLAEPYPEWYLI